MKAEELKELIEKKSSLLLDLEIAKRTSGSDVKALAIEVARLEGVIAAEHLKANRNERGTANMISQASCLVDADAIVGALSILRKALRVAPNDRIKGWIRAELLNISGMKEAEFNDLKSIARARLEVALEAFGTTLAEIKRCAGMIERSWRTTRLAYGDSAFADGNFQTTPQSIPVLTGDAKGFEWAIAEDGVGRRTLSVKARLDWLLANVIQEPGAVIALLSDSDNGDHDVLQITFIGIRWIGEDAFGRTALPARATLRQGRDLDYAFIIDPADIPVELAVTVVHSRIANISQDPDVGGLWIDFLSRTNAEALAAITRLEAGI